MTVSPTAGVAPLTVATAQPQVQQPTSLHAVLAGGANLGGGDPLAANDFGIPAVAGVNTAPTAVAAANGTAPAAATGGGGTQQAAQGAAAVTPELITALQNVISTLNALIGALQAQGGVAGGGGAAPAGGDVSGGGAAGGCGMSGCSMSPGGAVEQASAGANGAPKARGAGRDARQGARQSNGGAGAPATAAAPAGAGTVNPSTVKDKASTAGLTAASLRGLEEAHKHGLPLVSGKRSGGAPGSDHVHGNAIDVGTLPIGSASSSHGTPEMVAYAEHMRQAGKAGQLNVKYVIHNGQIASATNNWEWRAYTYPGKSAGELEALKRSNRGEYNRLQHYDHVHVSFG